MKCTIAPSRTAVHERQGLQCGDDWECEWERMKKERKKIKAFVDGLDIVKTLTNRDAFRGGRTNAVKLYLGANEEKEDK